MTKAEKRLAKVGREIADSAYATPVTPAQKRVIGAAMARYEQWRANGGTLRDLKQARPRELVKACAALAAQRKHNG